MYNALYAWIHSQTTPCLENITRLPAEDVPQKQVDQSLKAAKKGKTWVKAYQNEEPLVLATAEEQEDFKKHRTASSTWMALTATWYGIGGVLFDHTSIAPSDDQLKYWMQHSSIGALGVKGFLSISPYEKMKTLRPDMKHFGTELSYSETALQFIKLILPNLDSKKSTIIYVSPTDPAWSTAKLMLMHNLNHELVLHQHPCIHVLATTVNHLLQQHIPDCKHPLRRFLDPHLRFTDVITDKVLNDSHSILMDHVSTFSPFDIDINTVHSFHIQNAHKRFQFDIYNNAQLFSKQIATSPYISMMKEYRQVIRKWTDTFLQLYLPWAKVQVDTPVHKWWKSLREHYGRHFVPRKNTQKLTYKLLLECLTMIVFSCSIVHSTDHYLYSQIPPIHKPWRWHGSLPQSAQDDTSQPELTSWDLFQAHATNHMFFGVNPATTLGFVQYESCPMDNLKLQSQLDIIYAKYGLVHPDKISVSIDW